MHLNLFFLCQFEVLVNFVVGFYDQGVYVDSLPAIARRYCFAVTGFWFDLSTSIPFDWVDYVVSLVGRPCGLFDLIFLRILCVS